MAWSIAESRAPCQQSVSRGDRNVQTKEKKKEKEKEKERKVRKKKSETIITTLPFFFFFFLHYPTHNNPHCIAFWRQSQITIAIVEISESHLPCFRNMLCSMEVFFFFFFFLFFSNPVAEPNQWPSRTFWGRERKNACLCHTVGTASTYLGCITYECMYLPRPQVHPKFQIKRFSPDPPTPRARVSPFIS